MEKPILAVDLDGTVGDPYAWLPRVNRIFELSLTKENFHHLKIRSNEGCQHVPSDFYKNNKSIFHKDIGMREGAVETLVRLQERFELIFVTGRTEDLKEITEKWFKDYGLSSDFPVVYLGPQMKTVWTDQYKPIAFLEDSVPQSKAISESGIPVILMDTSYNRSLEGKNIIRAKDWEEAEEILIKGLYKEKAAC
ncbi:nucleotidase [Gottschalkiaceae bacterium SANA]|nr:nucleotidase [Gottschalkiaceae bacterium SANA]